MKLTPADVKAMDEGELYWALSLIQEEIKGREEGGFADVVSDYLSHQADADLKAEIAEGGGAVKLTFASDHWDNGYFYSEQSGVVDLRNGGSVEVDFSQTMVHDALTELSGVRRREDGLDSDSVLVVDLVTGEVEHGARH